MRNVIYLAAVLMMCLICPVSAQPSDALQMFDEGNLKFREGLYTEAVTAYEAALETGFESAALHYNLGTAFYRLDQLGMAVVHLEKANEINPEIPELEHSLTLVRSLRADQFSRVPDPFWKPVMQRLERVASPSRYFFVGFIFYLIALIFVALFVTGRVRNNWIRRLYFTTGAIGTLLIITAFAVSIHVGSEVRYVLVGDEADVLENPDELASRETRIHEGTVFEYLGETDGWLHIELPNGVEGWVVNENVIRI